MLGPLPFGWVSFPPPPRSGFAIRVPTPPKLKPLDTLEEARPRVEPNLAASKRSLTAESCASNLLEVDVSYLVENMKVGNYYLPLISIRQLFLTVVEQSF